MRSFWKTKYINPPEVQGQVVRLLTLLQEGKRRRQGIKITNFGQQENARNRANQSNPENQGWIEYIIWITITIGVKGFKRMGKAYSFL